MEDITTLVSQVAGTLAPAIPYLLKASELAGEEAAKKIGGDAWERAKKLWSRVGDKLIAKPAAQEVVSAIALAPAEPDAQASLRFQLKRLLLEDKELAATLLAELRSNTPPTGNNYQQIGGVIFNDKAEIHGIVTGRDSLTDNITPS